MSSWLKSVPSALVKSPGRVVGDARAVFRSNPLKTMTNPINNPRSLLGYAVNKVEYVGASYYAGKINAEYGEKAQYNGMPITFLVGIAGMTFGFVNDVLLGEAASPIVSHLHNIGTALFATHWAAKGAQEGARAAGKELQLGEPGKGKKFIMGNSGQTMVGEIPPAPSPGKYLDLNEINRLAAMHG